MPLQGKYMINRISESIKRLFPQDFDELVPIKRHWWQRINLNFFKGNKKKIWLWIIGIYFVAKVMLGLYFYNQFVILQTQVNTEMAQINAHLQRRKDLIINLTLSVQDYEEHERKMFKYMADKRSILLDNSDKLIEIMKKEGLLNTQKLEKGGLEDYLASLMALAENYPILNLSANFQKLMDQLMNIEDRIVERRMAYNTACNMYGTYIKQFPQLIFAYGLHFKNCDYIKIDADVELFDRVDLIIDKNVKLEAY